VLNLQMEKIEEWETIPELDYVKNCVSVDKAEFNLQTQRNHDRSRKDTTAKDILLTAKGITITILGAMSQASVIDISLKQPQAVSMSKKRKANDTATKVTSGQVGTKIFLSIYLTR
jgi:hypothetical protein